MNHALTESAVFKEGSKRKASRATALAASASMSMSNTGSVAIRLVTRRCDDRRIDCTSTVSTQPLNTNTICDTVLT